jgi:hypothetical protein
MPNSDMPNYIVPCLGHPFGYLYEYPNIPAKIYITNTLILCIIHRYAYERSTKMSNVFRLEDGGLCRSNLYLYNKEVKFQAFFSSIHFLVCLPLSTEQWRASSVWAYIYTSVLIRVRALD